MMLRNLCLTMNFLILGACASDLFGGFIVTIGTTPLDNYSEDARLPVYVHWDGNDANVMRGIRLSAAIGDGTANQSAPRFRVTEEETPVSTDTVLFVDALTGTTPWEFFGDISFGGLPSATDSRVIPFAYVSNGFLFQAAPAHEFEINEKELVAEFRINTSGIGSGRFDLNIGGETGSSFLMGVSPVSDPVNFDISFSGSFDVGNVSAVPEPGSGMLAVLACAGAAGVSKRRLRFTRRRGESAETLVQ